MFSSMKPMNSNVSVRHADGSKGSAADGPFDVIALSGSVPQVPQVLFDQLKTGGRLVAIVGQLPIMQAVLYTRSASGGAGERSTISSVAA
jgi:protein-L-isoaspartate(D-aspartate) O-methyltransferase